MSGNDQKTPLVRTLNQVAQNRAMDAIQITGKSLPCQVVSKMGSIVKVSFLVNGAGTLPNVVIPVAGPQYIRYPLQPGCLGVAAAMDVRLGGITGLGAGTASITDVPNLTALVFIPVGNVGFSSVDPDTLVLYGEPNVQIQDKTGASTGLFTPSGITLSSHGHSVIINSSGVIIDGKVFLAHVHIDGGGTGDSGPVGP